jgi:hypothetical protein
MNKFLLSCVAFAVLASTAIAQLPKKKAPEGASVYFLSPKDGETVSSPVTVRFGLKGMGVAPAGVDQPNTGHHHLLVDMPKDPDFDAALPVTDNIRHFGAGQTETELKLPPGKHTLQLVFGDSLHIPHDKPIVSPKITITVK